MRKCQKTGIFNYFGAQSAPKIGLLRPIFSILLKVLAMSMWSNTDVETMNTFWENEQRPEFWLIWGPKLAPKLGLWGPYSTQHWKHYSDVIITVVASQITGVSVVYSTFCSGADQRKYQSSASLVFVRGIHQWPMNSPHIGASNVSIWWRHHGTCNEHAKQCWCESSEHFLWKWPKSGVLTYLLCGFHYLSTPKSRCHLC